MKKTLKAFAHACRGILLGIKKERNFRIQFVCALLSIGCGIFFHLSGTEWCILLICIAAVLSIELINTAIEHLCNFMHEEYHPSVRTIKDVSAGAVLVIALAALACGAFIFLPKIISLINAIKIK